MTVEICWFCREKLPVSRAVVYENGKVTGKICAGHSVRELLLPPKGSPKFNVIIEYLPDDQPD